MTKKRKACSPPQENQSDLCAELKEFIVKENAKCVKEIKDSNERRISAMEDSLSFAMDAISSVSARQTSADRDIRTLQKETAELRSRLQTLELQEDRQSQERRRGCLVFFWTVPAVPPPPCRLRAADHVGGERAYAAQGGSRADQVGCQIQDW